MNYVKNILFGKDYNVYETAPVNELDLQGWGSQSPAFAEAISRHQPKLIVEVGTWKGGSAIHMANLCKQKYGNSDFEIVCIDTFLGSLEHWNRVAHTMAFNYGRPNLYNTFVSNVIRTNNADVITPFPVDSHNGWQVLLHFGVMADMIYIDAGHDFDAVVKDIEGFKQVLKPGGVLLGDDVLWWQSVLDACNATLPGWTTIEDKFYWVKP
jgi:SAM-dependent methyltransferase